MKPTNFELLAAVIAAHTNGELVGRTRLQKTVKLLQRLKYPSRYIYKLSHYGPYSEGVQSDISVLEMFGLVNESERGGDPRKYFVLKASDNARLEATDPFADRILRMEDTDATVLELAATYDAFREWDLNHEQALQSLRAKKGPKCDEGREELALELLRELELPVG